MAVNASKRTMHVLASALTLMVAWPASAQKSAAPSPPCSQLINSAYPQATLSNGSVDVTVYLPDAERGSYRSSRFDWSGVVACASYRGHTFFGPWSDNTDPLGNDTVTGPVEEFRGDQGEIGYDQAKPGDPFLKIGVGVLRRLDDAPYSFGKVYPILDGGKWTVSKTSRSITFKQQLSSSYGYAYTYEKVLELNPKQPVMTLRHKLTNLGTAALKSNVYDHDFFTLDQKQVGPGMAVTFGFQPSANPPFPQGLVSLEGNTMLFTDTPRRDYAAQGYLTGYTGAKREYFFKVEDRNTQASVTQTSEAKLAKLYFWSTSRTICPEAYIALDVAPKAAQQWAIQYRFDAPK